MRAVLKKLKNIFESKLHFSVQVQVPYEVLGNEEYGAWAAVTRDITKDSIVYSFGVGEDASWDIALIEKYGVKVHAFDPTPKSIAWADEQCWPSGFVFHAYGLGAHDGMQHFGEPLKAHWASYSPTRGGKGIEAPVKRLLTIMRELGHDHIDILKMDIEGGEYAVIDDILESKVRVRQVLVEFHHRWGNAGPRKTYWAVEMLQEAGYSIFYVSNGQTDFGFIR